MTITLSSAQLQKMQAEFALNTSKPNCAGMFQYIYKELKNQMPTDQGYWFQQAAEINRFLNDTSRTPV